MTKIKTTIPTGSTNLIHEGNRGGFHPASIDGVQIVNPHVEKSPTVPSEKPLYGPKKGVAKNPDATKAGAR
jgi:hypothetical protein